MIVTMLMRNCEDCYDGIMKLCSLDKSESSDVIMARLYHMQERNVNECVCMKIGIKLN